MDEVLLGIPGVLCYIDDILVSGKAEKSHLKSLEEVFRRLGKHGFRLKPEKCEFLLSSVEYLGHQISKDGICALPSKVAAIDKAPAPTNIQELHSFLGLLNYYGKFMPNLAIVLHPLNALLQTDREWTWSKECDKAFKCAIEQLTSGTVLTHYDSTLPISLAADASAYGVGAVISHVFPDGSERPIAFASRTLTSSERNYAQLEKEALSLVFGVKKFNQYLYGRKFTLITDHQPLTTILRPKKRYLRWPQLDFNDGLLSWQLMGTSSSISQPTLTVMQMVFQGSHCPQVMHRLAEESVFSTLVKYRHSLLPSKRCRKLCVGTRL